MRTGGARVLVTLGALLIAVGVLAGVVNREVLDGDRFARHVDAIRTDPAVARQIGLLVSDRVLDQQPELVSVRPLLESASTAVVASPSLGPVVRSTIAPLHRALVSGGEDQVVLRLADVGALLVAAITTLDPDSTAAVPDDLDVTLSAIGSQELTADLISLAHLVALLSWLLPLLGVACLVAAALLRSAHGARPSPLGNGLRGDRRSGSALVRRALWWIAGGLAVLTVVIGLIVNRLDESTLTGALVQGAWHEFDGALWRSVAVLGVIAVVVSIVNRPGVSLRSLAQDVTGWFDGSELTAGERAGRAVVLLLVGLALVLEPLTVLSVLAGIVGVVIVLIALRDLGRAALSALPRLAEWLRPAVLRTVVLGVVAVVLAGLVVIGAWPSDSAIPPAAADGDDTCNGHAALCDRTYDQVAFPATHNSMSAADGRGWFLAEQPTGVMGQLDDGIRVFLIDSWPGQATAQPGIAANTQDGRAKALEQARSDFGPEVVDSALRLREALNLAPRGEVTPFLCHALCELGSTEWIPLMRQVKTWMDAYPREVVTFFIQDEVSPKDTADVFDQAGLTPYIHHQSAGEPWPTLGELIDSGHRIVVLHEHTVDPDVPWILDGSTWVQDTPYAFHAVDDFSCDLYRGQKSSPLFLVNHWLSNPRSRIADAELVNARPVLLARLEQCRTERGHIPNFVAVDNYDKGDLIASVDALNGVG